MITLLQPIRNAGPRVQDGSGNEIFVLDASLGESHDTSGDLTDHPVEDGSVVTDHLILRPFELTITGFVTNTPTDPQLEAAALELANQGGVSTRVQATYGIMLELLRLGGTLTIDTGLKTYENMILTNVSVPRGVPTQAIRPQLKFRQVTFAYTQVIDVPANLLAPAKQPSGETESDDDQQAEAEAKPKEKTLAKKTIEVVADFITGQSGK